MSDEYIKKSDALKAMEWKWAGKEAFEAVDALPAADVAPVVHGKWEDGKCSNCGCNFGRAFPFSIMPRFCPDCGATMDFKA